MLQPVKVIQSALVEVYNVMNTLACRKCSAHNYIISQIFLHRVYIPIILIIMLTYFVNA